jgi:hypothetical protein
MSDWIPVPLDAKMFQNVDETSLTKAHATLENGFVTEAAGFSRFPGLTEFVSLPSQGRIYLNFWGDDMIAQTQAGRLYRINKAGDKEDLTDVPLGGGLRPIFAQTADYLAMAAGGDILGFDGKKTFILAPGTPPATHVACVDEILVANERDSGRFGYSAAGDVRTFDPLDVFSAAGSSDPITALFITPFRELLVCGPQSVEQYERLAVGDAPFFRRWSVAEGIVCPYTLTFADNAAWGINENAELARFSGQISQSTSDDIGRTLDKIDNWDEAWSKELQIKGQKFIFLSIPNATNPYGDKGITLLFDFRQQRWTSLWAWDMKAARPVAYPIWSFVRIWNKTYAGGVDKIFRFDDSTHYIGSGLARMLLRTAHLSELGEVRIDNLRLRLKRGVGSYTASQKIGIRANRDNRGFGAFVRRSFGLAGQREMFIEFGGMGCATTWQFEIQVTDDCPVEIAGMQVQLTRLGRRG